MLKQDEIRLKYNVAIKNTFEKLHQEQKEQYPEVIQHNNETVERHWKTVKNTLKSASQEILPKKGMKNKSQWMTNEILNKMQERRRLKHTNKAEYERINKQIAKECKEAKENWLNNQCEEIENLEK